MDEQRERERERDVNFFGIKLTPGRHGNCLASRSNRGYQAGNVPIRGLIRRRWWDSWFPSKQNYPVVLMGGSPKSGTQCGRSVGNPNVNNTVRNSYLGFKFTRCKVTR